MGTFICGLYLAASEWVPLKGSKGEVLLFPKGHTAIRVASEDEESQVPKSNSLSKTDINEEPNTVPVKKQQELTPFLWDHLTYEIKTSQGPLTLLSGIQGWVKQGSLTAVMVCDHETFSVEGLIAI